MIRSVQSPNEAPLRANKRYLELLQLAARQGEARVDEALRCLPEQGEMGEGKLTAGAVRQLLEAGKVVDGGQPLPPSVRPVSPAACL